MAEPQFDAQENFRRIEMDKGTTYLVVEGNEVDVFDSVMREILGQKHIDVADFTVVSGSDKRTIIDFLESSSANNFFVIVDRDFDQDALRHSRASSLRRYSIENYCFDDLVVKRALARVIGKSIANIEYSSDFIMNYYVSELTDVMKHIISYQSTTQEKPFSWSDRRLLNKDCWKIDSSECNKLILDIRNFFGSIAPNNGKPITAENIPGKMILSGIYYYIKNKIGFPKFTKLYNNCSIFSGMLLSSLGYSRDFCSDLTPAANFIRNQQFQSPG